MIKTTTVRCLALCTALCLAVLAATPSTAFAQSRPDSRRGQAKDPVQSALDEAIRAELKRLVWTDEGQLTPAGFSTALREVNALQQQAAWYIEESNTDLFRELSRTERLLRLMVEGRQTQNSELWSMLVEHPDLADAVAFTLQPGRDQLGDAMLVLDSLRRQFGAERLAAYANLTAAICAVHDQPRSAPGRNPTASASPNEIWAYYVRYEDRMALGVKSMPADLLAHVVDTTASVAEMQWAMERYGRDPQVGNRYAEISYDDNALNEGQSKRIDSEQYTLQNIRRVGGVCSEQAYFAAHVGKAMGVPTVEVSSIGSTMAHAWLGFLRVRGRQAVWDFESGRYDEYKKYVGSYRDPLAGREQPEGHVAILSQIVGTTPEQIQVAVAMHDAAAALAEFEENSDAPTIALKLDVEQSVAPVRVADDAGISELLTAAFKSTGAERRIWDLAGRLARDRRIAGDDLEAIFAFLERLCGRNEASYFATTAPQLLWALEDSRVQARMYDRVARAVRNVPGQEAEVRFLQGDGFRDREMYQEAMNAYLLPTKYRNLDGPWTVEAVDRITALLNTTGKMQHLPDLLADIFRRVPRPSTEGSFAQRRGSVWAQVGERYHRSLVLNGRTNEAQNVRRQLDTIVRLVP